MKIRSKTFRVPPGEKVKLGKWPTIVQPFCKSKKRYQKLLAEHVEELSSLQRLHYASNRYALLLIFQGMDAAGKDGVIRHVMSGVNPQSCEGFSFKQPSAEELKHDFLWRTTAIYRNAGGSASSIVPKGECPVDCFPNCSGCAQGTEDGISQDHRETSEGIEVSPQTALKATR